MGKRTENKQRKRAEIIANAHQLFRTEGYDQVTTAQIAAASHIAKKTFFQYFPTKDAVLFVHETAWLTPILAWLATDPQPVWPAYVHLLTERTQQDAHASLAHDLFADPALVLETPAVAPRLAAMWRTYETRISHELIRRNLCADAVTAQALALRMVAVLRLALEADTSVGRALTVLDATWAV